MEYRINKYFSRQNNNSYWLFFFRISVAGFCILHYLAMFPDIKNILTSNSYILPDIVDSFSDHLTPNIYSLNTYLQKYLHVSYNLYVLSGVYIVALFSLMIGFGTRLSGIIAALCHITIVASIDFFTYGVDFFCTIALFYCIIFPVGKYYSVDASLRKKSTTPNNVIYENICLKLLQVHMCIIYFFSGFDKVIGFNWRNGESVWKSIHLSYNPRLINVDGLSHTPIFLIIGWATVIIEMLYPVFMNIKKTRNIWLVSVIMLHISIALFIGLFFFSTFMILLSVAAFYVPYLSFAEKAEFVRNSFGKENHLVIIYDGQCGFCNAFIAKLTTLNVNNGNYVLYDMRDQEGRKLLKEHDVSFVNLNTIYCLYNGEVRVKSSAIFFILSFARKPYCYIAYLGKLPVRFTDYMYSVIARRRYAISKVLNIS